MSATGARIAFTLVGIAAALAAFAAEPASFDVTAFGAVGDGKTLNTTAIQTAVDACSSSGGGSVRFPPGRFLTGTVYLKDNVDLHLDTATVILGSADLKDYPVNRCEYPSRSDSYTGRALLWAEGKTNISISGAGVIDGQGSLFRDNKATPEDMKAQTEAYEKEGRYTPSAVYFNRPYLIRFVSCRNVRVEDVTLRYSAMWMQHYLDCDFLTVRNIKVYNHGAANNDMIDIDGCRNVVMSDCIGDSDDDALTLKSTGARPTEHVVISNCILSSHCNAIKAGTESAGGFKDITITNCVVRRSAETNAPSGRAEGLAGIALEIVDGGTLDRVAISNITVEGTTAPLFLRLGDRGRSAKPSDPKPAVGALRNVTISNVVATGASSTGCAISGLPDHPIENVTLSNIRMSFAGGGTAEQANANPAEEEGKYPESTMFGVLPAYGLFVRHVNGLTLRDVEVSFQQADLRPALVCHDVQNAQVYGLIAAASPDAVSQIVMRDCTTALVSGCRPSEIGAFLKLAGTASGVAVIGNDLRAAKVPFAFEAPATVSALAESGNLLAATSPQP